VAESLATGIDAARQAIERGAALERLERLATLTASFASATP
jgi:anthranilate phosphoribosyltransferase